MSLRSASQFCPRLTTAIRSSCRYLSQNNTKLSGDERKAKVAVYARTLQLPDEFSESDVREAFVSLAKKYHPDSRSELSCPTTFSKIKEAYTYIINVLQNPDVDEQEAAKEQPDIKHTVPQHRHFLSFEGIGYGTIAQRQKQYDLFRADRANENIYEYRKDKSNRENENSLVQLRKNKNESRKVKTSNHIDRLVEDLIKESMARGDFDNLPGSGKPLKSSSHDNPYVDATTYNLNKILINNGFAPEWITLEKEIKDEYKKLKDDLWLAYDTAGHEQPSFWRSSIDDFRDGVQRINKKIDKFNIIVPSLHLQMAHYKAEKAIDDIQSRRYPADKAISETPESSTASDSSGHH